MINKKPETLKLEIFCVICGRKLPPISGKDSLHSSTYNMEICYTCLEENEEKDEDPKSFYLIIPTLTEIEDDVIMNGIAKTDLFKEHFRGVVWLDTLIEKCKIAIPTQLSGAISSLIKKGIVAQNGYGIDSTIQLNAEGYTYYLKNR